MTCQEGALHLVTCGERPLQPAQARAELRTITELTRLAPGQRLPVRYRPAVMDHYVALARDADPAQVRRLFDEIASRKRA